MPTARVQLTGTINNPDGSGFNGAFLLSLNTYGSVQLEQGGYVGVPKSAVIRVPIVDGIVASVGVWGNDVISPKTWYIVKMITSTGDILWTDNFYIAGAGPFDMGSAQPIDTSGLTFTASGVVAVPELIFVDQATGLSYALTVVNGSLESNPVG